MRLAAFLAVVVSVSLLVGCGATGAKSHNTKDVKRAFANAGVPIRVIFDSDVALTAKQLEKHGVQVPVRARNHVKAALLGGWSGPTSSRTATVVLVFVLDSSKAVKEGFPADLNSFPQLKNEHVFAYFRKLNVVVLALSYGRTADPKNAKRVRNAIAAL